MFTAARSLFFQRQSVNVRELRRLVDGLLEEECCPISDYSCSTVLDLLCYILCVIMCQVFFSIGVRSGLQEGHIVVIEAVCGLALSCTNMQDLP